MCQSYRKACACGEKTAEIFFGRMILDEKAVKEVYCPKCSHGMDTKTEGRVFDNGWVLELNMDVVKCLAPVMEISPDEITAERVFDEGFATWVGITPDDYQNREKERSEIQKLAEVDVLAFMKAMKEWGVSREKRFAKEGWRKMRAVAQ